MYRKTYEILQHSLYSRGYKENKQICLKCRLSNIKLNFRIITQSQYYNSTLEL